jgi:uncharacterized membrane protein YqaE (UPF0057 family)
MINKTLLIAFFMFNHLYNYAAKNIAPLVISVNKESFLPFSITTSFTDSTTENAIKDLKSLKKAEKKARVKEIKKTIKNFKHNKNQGQEASTNQLLLVILALLLPPLAVYLHQGEVNTKFWISLLLTLIFWLPGIIYALLVVLNEI